MSLQISTTAAVKIFNITFIARVVSTCSILVDGQEQVWAFVSVPELGEGWVSPTSFVSWIN